MLAVGHTFGVLTFRSDSDEGRAVLAAMNNARFSERSTTFSYDNFYLGFGHPGACFNWLLDLPCCHGGGRRPRE
ncbi:hypothetical protein [Tunturiibacter empetritectus]|uniref:hypothetical protein n=1 Tax=Tunturiibacter empetritectus TaxID=3069691 RepID=UPI003D9ADB4F